MSDFVLIIAIVFVLVLLAISYVIASFGLTAFFGAPYVGTPKKIAKEMLEFAGLKNGEVFMDLGSGSGTLLLVAAKEFHAKKAIGYEINPLLVFITNIRARFWGVHKIVEVRQGNIFKETIPQADVIGLYLLSPAMKRLFPRLKQSQKTGTRLISRGFTFEDVEVDGQMQGVSSILYRYLLK